MTPKNKLKPDIYNADFGISVHDLFESKTLPNDVLLIAGRGGADRIIKAVTVMEAPDFINWVKKDELLLTTAFAIANNPVALHNIIPSIAEKGLAALGIKPGRFLEHIPDEMIFLANELKFPLIRIPYHVSLSDLIMPVTYAICERQTRYFNLSEKMHDVLMKATFSTNGLYYFGKTLYELVKNPLSIRVDTLDITINIPDNESINDLINNGESISDKASFNSYGENHKIKKQLINWKGKKIQQIIFPIIAGKEELGLITVWEIAPLSRLATIALERSISIIAYEIMKSYAVIGIETRYKSIVMDQLLEPSNHASEQVEERAKLFGWDLKPPFCVFVIRSYNNENEHAGTQSQTVEYLNKPRYYLCQLIKKIFPELIVAEKSDHIVIICTTPSAKDEFLKDLLNKISNSIKSSLLLNHFSFDIGVGRIYQSKEGLPLSYNEACKALKIYRQTHHKQTNINPINIVHFNKLGIWRLLSLIQNQDEVDDFIKDTICKLKEYDNKYNTNYIETLKVHMDHNCSIKRTAQHLNVHYNTIAYRLERIKTLFDIDLSDQMQRLSMELALMLFYDNS